MRPMNLSVLAIVILVILIAASAHAVADRSIFDLGETLTGDPWFQVTVIDLYAGIAIFYAWVFARESSWLQRVGWLFLFLFLGNMATAIYLLIHCRSLAARPAEAS